MLWEKATRRDARSQRNPYHKFDFLQLSPDSRRVPPLRRHASCRRPDRARGLDAYQRSKPHGRRNRFGPVKPSIRRSAAAGAPDSQEFCRDAGLDESDTPRRLPNPAGAPAHQAEPAASSAPDSPPPAASASPPCGPAGRPERKRRNRTYGRRVRRAGRKTAGTETRPEQSKRGRRLLASGPASGIPFAQASSSHAAPLESPPRTASHERASIVPKRYRVRLREHPSTRALDSKVHRLRERPRPPAERATGSRRRRDQKARPRASCRQSNA